MLVVVQGIIMSSRRTFVIHTDGVAAATTAGLCLHEEKEKRKMEEEGNAMRKREKEKVKR